MMNNPCKQCIVQAACNNGCVELANYLKGSIKFRMNDMMFYWEIADGVRDGRFRLLDNDRDWESTP